MYIFCFLGSKTIFGEMWFHAGPASVSQRCRDSEHEMVGEVAEIQNIVQEGEVRGDTLHMVARMWDYQGKLRSDLYLIKVPTYALF